MLFCCFARNCNTERAVGRAISGHFARENAGSETETWARISLKKKKTRENGKSSLEKHVRRGTPPDKAPSAEPEMASCLHQWSREAVRVVPHRVGRRAEARSRRAALSIRPRALYQDVDSFWSEVRFPDERTSFEKAKEACWLAAYDAPFHGVPGGPYMHGRFAAMNDHIAKMHNRFLESSRKALCGHELSAREFADAVHRIRTALNVELNEAVRVVFGEPSLVAASEADIVRCLVELRRTHGNQDIARLVVASEGKLLAGAANVGCAPKND